MVIKKLIYGLAKLNPGIYISIFFIAILLIQLPFLFISTDSQNTSVVSIKNELGLTGLFFISVIIAPIFETLIYQVLIIEGFRYFLRKFISLKFIFFFSTFASSLAFSIDHLYSIYYFVAAFCTGFIFATLYHLSKLRKEPALFYPLFLHSFWNLFVFFMSNILDL